MFDNEDEPTYHRMFACNPRVRVQHFPMLASYTTGIQNMAQRYFMEHFNHRHTWAMLPNADEFIVVRAVAVTRTALRVGSYERHTLTPDGIGGRGGNGGLGKGGWARAELV